MSGCTKWVVALGAACALRPKDREEVTWKPAGLHRLGLSGWDQMFICTGKTLEPKADLFNPT